MANISKSSIQKANFAGICYLQFYREKKSVNEQLTKLVNFKSFMLFMVLAFHFYSSHLEKMEICINLFIRYWFQTWKDENNGVIKTGPLLHFSFQIKQGHVNIWFINSVKSQSHLHSFQACNMLSCCSFAKELKQTEFSSPVFLSKLSIYLIV